MRKIHKYFSLMSAAALLAACEAAPMLEAEASMEAAPAVERASTAPTIVAKTPPSGFSAFNFQWFPPLAASASNGKPGPVRGMSNNELNDAMELANGAACPNYKACAARLKTKLNAPGRPNPNGKLSGVGSTGVSTLVAVADNTPAGEDAEVWAKGQIQSQCLDANGNPQSGREGYSYNSTNGSLRICVVVRTTMKVAGQMTSTFEYYEVEASGVDYERSCVGRMGDPNCAGTSNQNVFPKAARDTGLEIPASKTTPVPGVVLNYKLYAGGTGIAVKRYGLIENVTWSGPTAPSPAWDNTNLYDRWQGNGTMTQRLRKIFARNDASCVDMMFVGVPPSSLALDQRVVYCLGRCKNPAILNTL